MEVECGEGHGATSSSGPIWARSVFRGFIPNTPLEAEVTGKRGLRRRRLASEPSAGSDVDSIRANRSEQKNVGSRHGVRLSGRDRLVVSFAYRQGLVAEVDAPDGIDIVAGARYHIQADDGRCEFVITVADGLHDPPHGHPGADGWRGV